MLTGEPSAAELKQLAAKLDGVVTGRMHLAIAALGSGVPVATFAYQDKFEGLLMLFGLPQTTLGTLSQLLDVHRLAHFIESFLHELPELGVLVHSALPEVMQKAESNLD
jgi:colanic acid/amylovoran biosynthesis protein